MRIVSGEAKGRHLRVPARGTRPTSDRAREALFNTLRGLAEIEQARVLDLFAGTGAVGLEALSRGASRVTFVENDRQTAKVLQENIATVGLPGTRVMRCTATAYLLAAGAEEPFEIAFADPPYALPEEALGALLDGLVQPRWLAPGAVVVVERSARGPGPRWPDAIDPVKERRYGAGVLWYGRRR